MATRRSLLDSWNRPLLLMGSIVLVVASLFWARSILIPVVIAILLTFVLSPPVTFLHRRGLGRVPAVIVVVLLAILLIAGIGAAVSLQLQRLTEELPQYKTAIVEKIRSLNEASTGSWLEGLNETILDISHKTKDAAAASGAKTDAEPVPVRIVSQPLSIFHSAALPLMEGLIEAGFVLVLVLFMLIKREDLRNRLIRLGDGNVTKMTKAIDEVGRRTSRFLLMQLTVNGCFGLIVMSGLLVIGVPYPLIWGMLAATLRYIPYLGVWGAALFPIGISFAVFESWLPLLLVAGLFAVLELTIANFVEPVLYGKTVGVSEVALLIAAAFWAWVWGPLGLVLSTPLTACLAVLGRHVPSLEAIGILLGDEPALKPHLAYYQRMLAKDQDEASALVEDYLEKQALEQAFDEIIVPALILGKRNRDRLTGDDERFLCEGTREIIDGLDLKPHAEDAGKAGADKVLIFGCPARDAVDELALELLQKLLPCRFQFVILSWKSLAAEILERIRADRPGLVVIGALPVKTFAHTRYLCKQLRRHFPDLKIIVGFWGLESLSDSTSRRLCDAGADHIATTLAGTRSQIVPLFPVLEFKERQEALEPSLPSV